jgi:hypothetical protein
MRMYAGSVTPSGRMTGPIQQLEARLSSQHNQPSDGQTDHVEEITLERFDQRHAAFLNAVPTRFV